MRIVIDGQILQSPGLNGESFEHLSKMLVELADEWRTHEVFLILGGRASARTARIRADFSRVLPAPNIRSWYGVEPFDPRPLGGTWQHRSAQLIREGLLASLDPDVVVVPLSTAFTALEGVFSNGLLHDHPTLVFVHDAQAAETGQFVAEPGAAARAGALDGPGPSTTIPAQSPEVLRARLAAAIDSVQPRAPKSAAASRPRLAFVSPLPPERSGISFYSAELLPALASHYEIDLVVDQRRVAPGAWRDGMRVRDAKWFSANARSYDRILYQFGNSGYHRHMFALLEAHPGVVVLHDFFLSGIVSRMDRPWVAAPGFWLEELHASHGYAAAAECLLSKHAEDVIWTYPCSGSVQENATGVIVHSESTRSLARHWHGAEAWRRMAVVPHMRAAQDGFSRDEARRALGFGADDFVVCSFGVLGTTKLNHRLLDAWLSSPLARDAACKLVFAGANERSAYGRDIADRAKASGGGIQVTGWLDEERYQQYL
ncbi:MAG: hypothetical protein Q8Q62_20175, partial [Mesorhizobium sp.]|nr:hypothetical protein [Mesorhizobium sp.]